MPTASEKLKPMYHDAFLEALGAWQRGWQEDPARRIVLAANLRAQAAALSERVCQVHQQCYRKRFLYKGDFTSIILGNGLDEGVTSWTVDRAYAENFKGLYRAEAVTAAIFAHTPTAEESLLNVVALWSDPEFVAALGNYCARNGPNADALMNFQAQQGEVILHAPLCAHEVIGLTGIGSAFDDLCDSIGLIQSARTVIFRDLVDSGSYPGEPTWVWDERALSVIARTQDQVIAKIEAAMARQNGN